VLNSKFDLLLSQPSSDHAALEELEKLKDELTAVRTQVNAIKNRKDQKLDMEKVMTN